MVLFDNISTWATRLLKQEATGPFTEVYLAPPNFSGPSHPGSNLDFYPPPFPAATPIFIPTLRHNIHSTLGMSSKHICTTKQTPGSTVQWNTSAPQLSTRTWNQAANTRNHRQNKTPKIYKTRKATTSDWAGFPGSGHQLTPTTKQVCTSKHAA